MARLRKRHQDEIRQKIQVSVLVDLLHRNAMGTLQPEMSSSRVRSAQILLDKGMSDAPTELAGPGGEPLTIKIKHFAEPINGPGG